MRKESHQQKGVIKNLITAQMPIFSADQLFLYQSIVALIIQLASGKNNFFACSERKSYSNNPSVLNESDSRNSMNRNRITSTSSSKRPISKMGILCFFAI